MNPLLLYIRVYIVNDVSIIQECYDTWYEVLWHTYLRMCQNLRR